VVRLVALVAAALSVGWLLLRRRIRPGPTLRAVPDLPAPTPPAPPQPRTGTEPLPAGTTPAGTTPAVAHDVVRSFDSL
jgi:hypothetical protein